MPFSLARFGRRLMVFIAGLAVALVGAVAVLLLTMWLAHRAPITLPAPTGRFAVGRSMFVWTEGEAGKVAAQAASPGRQVIVWFWYPAVHSRNRGEYVPASWRAALLQQQGLLMRTFFKRDPMVVQTHSAAEAPVSLERRAYPVVLLRAGGSALTTDFTTLAEDLASHGFFVVGFDAPGRSFVVVLPDGRVVARLPALNVENANGNVADPVIGKLLGLWVSDTEFVVDQLHALDAQTSGKFAGRMDLQRLGMVGHSFGGAVALQFCHEDPRWKAAIDLDGIPFGTVVHDGLAKPAMFLLSDHSREMSDPATYEVLARIKSIYSRLPEGRLYAVIRTANHFSFSDQILLNSPIVVRLLGLAGFGALDRRRGLAISADYVRAFFEVHLNGAPPGSLTRLAQEYPEVRTAGE